MLTNPWLRAVLEVVLTLAALFGGVAIPRDWPPSGMD